MWSLKARSIIFSARLVGFLAGVLLILATFMAVQLSMYLDNRNEVYRAVMLYDVLFMKHPTPDEFQHYLKEHKLTPIGGEQMQRIKEKGTPLIEDPLLRRTFQSGNIEIFIFEDHYYYAYKMHDMYYYRSDAPMTPYKLYIAATFVALLMALVLLYRYISGSIEPLRNLYTQIRRFAEGEKGIDTHVEGSDEVAQVANAFHESVQKIELLQKSRSLFMRNLMHELKTPISKGKLLGDLLDIDEKDKALLNNLFEQMQGYLNDLARVDSLTTRSMELDIRSYAAIDVIDQAIDLLDVERAEIALQVNSKTINVDFNLFAYALKNLIDNALKYTHSKPILVTIEDECLTVANTGTPFKEHYTTYIKAYQRDMSQHALEGMGLGLYIVNEIALRHGYELRYRFEEGKHHFSICFD